MWYAGWADKYAQVTGSANPVAGPYFNFSLPEPTGVVGALAPQESSLLGLVSVLAPIITTGNTTVVVASRERPLPAVSLTEVLATSDLPGGVVNLLTGVPGGARTVASQPPRRERGRPHRRRPADRTSPAAGGRGQRQAGLRARGRGLAARPEHGPAGRVRRDQDGLASGRSLTGPVTTRLTTAR